MNPKNDQNRAKLMTLSDHLTSKVFWSGLYYFLSRLNTKLSTLGSIPSVSVNYIKAIFVRKVAAGRLRQ